MSKTWLIIEREYLQRVQKKSFIIVSLLMPFLMVLMMLLPTLINEFTEVKVSNIAVQDTSEQQYSSYLSSSSLVQYTMVADSVELKRVYASAGYDACLLIMGNPAEKGMAELVSEKSLALETTGKIERELLYGVRQEMLKAYSEAEGDTEVSDLFAKVNSQRVSLRTMKVENGKEKEDNTPVSLLVGLLSAMVIYMFVVINGSQVMNNVLEEKTSRIMEVMIQSVKPMQLMMGKVLGVALVMLTQIVIWFVVGGAGIAVVHSITMPDRQVVEASAVAADQNQPADAVVMNAQASAANSNGNVAEKVFAALGDLNVPLILTMFVFFFIAGFLLYASLFAAVGASCDSAQDAQQFTLPVMLPLFVALYIVLLAMKDPNSPILFWSSLIPFTSPIVMLARIPMGVEAWELVLSSVLLVATFVGCTWVAAKIYRTGILMYGKKPTWKEIFKWIKE